MATHDYVIANQGFPDFRSDLNNALSAIVSQNSSATEPATTFASMLWYDSANNTLKMRNEDNDAWISLLVLDQTNDAALIIQTTASTGSAKLPVGTTAQRDGSPATGYLRYNTTEAQFEGYDGSSWGTIGGTGFAAAGANSDITSLSGLTTALSTGQGGTGLTSLGTAGQVLTVNSGATALEYADAAGGGKVLQAVEGTLTSVFSTTSASFVTTGLSVNITPSATSSKILVIVSADFVSIGNNTGTAAYATARLYRDGSYINSQGRFGYDNNSSVSDDILYGVTSLSKLDSPSTTSSVTYDVRINATACTSYIDEASIVAIEIGA